MSFVLALTVILAIGAFASEGNLWAEKPLSEPVYSGYVVNGRDGHTGTEANCSGDYATHAPTNIKWELFKVGTEDTTKYALYFSIDNEGYAKEYAEKIPSLPYNGNTILYAYTYLGNSQPHGNGWTETSDKYVKHPWFAETDIGIEDITKIVIGNCITELKDGTFSNMRGVTVIEMPTSLTLFNGTPFKGCVALSTVYTRGQSPFEGIFNLKEIITALRQLSKNPDTTTVFGAFFCPKICFGANLVQIF